MAKRRWRRVRRRVAARVAAILAPLFVRLLSCTWRVEVVGEEHLREGLSGGKGLLITIWHGRMLMGMRHHAHRGYHVLVSWSGDGEISARLLAAFGYRVIRGSSSRGASRAVREMRDALRERAVVVITPDGPRGPRHSTNAGTAYLARETGFGIVPIGFGTSSAWRMRSWDRFTIPKPFARVRIQYAAPLWVPADASEADLERCTQEFASRLMATELAAHEALGAEPDWPLTHASALTAESRQCAASEVEGVAEGVAESRTESETRPGAGSSR